MKTTLIGTAVAAVIGVLVVAALVLRDVFSAAGAAYAFGMSDGADLTFPTATAVVFWLLLVLVPFETAVLVVKRLDWRDGRLEPRSPVDAWLTAHISLRDRTRRRVHLWVAEIKASRARLERRVKLAAQHVQPVSTTPAVVSTPTDEVVDAA